LLLVSSLSGIEDIKSSIQSLGYSVREKVTERFNFEQLVVLAANKKLFLNLYLCKSINIRLSPRCPHHQFDIPHFRNALLYSILSFDTTMAAESFSVSDTFHKIKYVFFRWHGNKSAFSSFVSMSLRSSSEPIILKTTFIINIFDNTTTYIFLFFMSWHSVTRLFLGVPVCRINYIKYEYKTWSQ
jgi:hypothetical protein